MVESAVAIKPIVAAIHAVAVRAVVRTAIAAVHEHWISTARGKYDRGRTKNWQGRREEAHREGIHNRKPSRLRRCSGTHTNRYQTE